MTQHFWRSFRIVFSVFALLTIPTLFVACSGRDEGASTPTTSPADVTPNASVPASVRAVMDAVGKGDAQALTSLLVYQPRPCTTTPGPGEVPCPDGSPSGTAVAVAPVGGCQSNWVGQSAAATAKAAAVARLLAFEPNAAAMKVRAVALPARTPTDIEAGTKYYVIAARQGSNDQGVLLGVNDTGVTFISTGCGTSVEELIQRFTNFLQPPTTG